jgi:hypothetical protein
MTELSAVPELASVREALKEQWLTVEHIVRNLMGVVSVLVVLRKRFLEEGLG